MTFGKRTVVEVIKAAIPTRPILIMAALVCCAAVGAHVVASAGITAGVPGAEKLKQMATTLEAMPLWVLIGAGMSQSAVRIDQAISDVRSWWSRDNS